MVPEENLFRGEETQTESEGMEKVFMKWKPKESWNSYTATT